MDQPQLIVGMKIVVVSATHAFKTLLLSLMEKKKKEKKEKDFSFVLGDRCYFLPVIFLYLFLSFFFYFANHYYSASRRTITFLLRCDPFNRLRKYFSFSFFLERSIWGHRLILKPIGTDYVYDEQEWETQSSFFFLPFDSHGYQMGYVIVVAHRVRYRASRKPHTPLISCCCCRYKSMPTSLSQQDGWLLACISVT